MPSSMKCMPEGTSPAHTDQLGRLGMDERVFKCTCCGWDSSHVLHKAHQDAESQSQNKKKSRKHQRFMRRRTLEKIKHLGSTKSEKALLATDLSEMDRKVDSLPWDPSQNRQLLPDSRVKAPKKRSALSPPMLDAASQPSFSQGSGSSKSAGSLPFPVPRKLRKCVAIDCEMVGTGPAGKTSELARCTVVNYDGDVIYDKYICPELPVVDYRTRWSGITQRHLENAIPFRIARKEVLQILKDKVVVGHAIHNDFRALKYFHPQAWVRDTSQSLLLRKKGEFPMKASISLKNLASHLLHKNIQVGRHGHSSVEDAQTSMELYRLVEAEWEQAVTSTVSVNPPDGSPDSGTDSDCYMDDQYWPKDLNVDCK